jgi:hypothetical protein
VGVMGLKPETKLLEVVAALGPAGGFPGPLHRREKERRHKRDDRDHRQQLDERKGRPGTTRRRASGTGCHFRSSRA